jgi:hypothetical protein
VTDLERARDQHECTARAREWRKQAQPSTPRRMYWWMSYRMDVDGCSRVTCACGDVVWIRPDGSVQ